MFAKNFVAACAALLFCAVGALAVPPFEAYGRLPSLDMMKLSPDGSTVAYVRAGEIKRWVVVQRLGDSKVLATVDVGDQKLRRVQWADNTHLILTASCYCKPPGTGGWRGEWFVPQVVDLTTGKQHNLIRMGAGFTFYNASTGVSAIRILGGHTIVYAGALYLPDAAHNVWRLGLFRIDLTDPEIRLASNEKDDAESWLQDENGKILAIDQYFEIDNTWRLLIYGNGKPDIKIDEKAMIESPGIAGLSEDGKSIILQLANDLNGRTIYDQISLADGSRKPWRRDQEIAGIALDPYTSRAVGAAHVVDKTDYIWFEPSRAKIWEAVKSAFKDATDVDLASWSIDRTKVIVKVFGPTYGNGYYFLDMVAHKAMPIGLEYEGVTQVAEEKWITYKAKDGLTIPAYLTLPIGREPKNLPLLVLPHGGPGARDDPGFDFLSQAFASLGYVVLQPEFRGSDELGKDLFAAGFGEIGKKMQTDLSDGVRALAAQGLIDPKRVCIAGFSYGGYAALAGATIDTGVYRCAISVSGVSDYYNMLKDLQGDDKWENPGVRYWKRYLGVESRTDSKVNAISPRYLADRITIPVMLIHGKDDTTVPFEQSVFMSNAMQSAGKPVEFIRLEGEDHHMSKSATRLQTLKAMRDFLLKNNPP